MGIVSCGLFAESTTRIERRTHDRRGRHRLANSSRDSNPHGYVVRFGEAADDGGVVMTPDMRTMFINVQHPGESTRYWNEQFGAPSPSNPSTVSSWPYGPGRRPRSATVVIRKVDGGRIGS